MGRRCLRRVCAGAGQGQGQGLFCSDCRQWVPPGARTLTTTKRLLDTGTGATLNGGCRGTVVIGLLRPDCHCATDRFPNTWTGGFDPERAFDFMPLTSHTHQPFDLL
jgi:hypothetical protein